MSCDINARTLLLKRICKLIFILCTVAIFSGFFIIVQSFTAQVFENYFKSVIVPTWFNVYNVLRDTYIEIHVCVLNLIINT
jgi:hypothetical protein